MKRKDYSESNSSERVYSRFAEVYDRMMEEIPYDEWCAYLRKLLEEQEITEGLVLELGCGTGSMTERMADAGYDMIGLDSSSDMLQKAVEKREQSGHDILYLLQDMTAFELFGTVAAIYSVCDCMNYLTDPEDFLETLKLVNNYLDPGGVFVFDLKTEFYFENVLADHTEAENLEDFSYIWENVYDPDRKINESALTLFIREEDNSYQKCEEFHYQRTYPEKEIRELAEKAGMEILKIVKAFSDGQPDEETERVYVILREKGKVNE